MKTGILKNIFRYIFPVLTAFLFSPGFGSKSNAHILNNPSFIGDTIPVGDSLAGPLPFPFKDKNTLPFQKQAPASRSEERRVGKEGRSRW